MRRLAVLLDEQPASWAAFEEFGSLARQLAAVPAGGLESGFAEDLPQDEQGPPAVLYESVPTLCRRLSEALDAGPAPDAWGPPGGAIPGAWGPGAAIPGARGPAAGTPPGGPPVMVPAVVPWPWRGAKELLRQTTYYALKRRAGTVGELGLGPLLGRLARTAPDVRVHLVGHGHGARLVAFALRGLPHGAHNVKSLTLLQGTLSHYSFACGLPHAPRGGARSPRSRTGWTARWWRRTRGTTARWASSTRWPSGSPVIPRRPATTRAGARWAPRASGPCRGGAHEPRRGAARRAAGQRVRQRGRGPGGAPRRPAGRCPQ
ncbi:hypothetical protein ACFQ60_13680 [Streptomyces zhihengii]